MLTWANEPLIAWLQPNLRISLRSILFNDDLDMLLSCIPPGTSTFDSFGPINLGLRRSYMTDRCDLARESMLSEDASCFGETASFLAVRKGRMVSLVAYNYLPGKFIMILCRDANLVKK